MFNHIGLGFLGDKKLASDAELSSEMEQAIKENKVDLCGVASHRETILRLLEMLTGEKVYQLYSPAQDIVS